MIHFSIYSGFSRPGLHIWREGTSLAVDLRPVSSRHGWHQFQYRFDRGKKEKIQFLLFNWSESNKPEMHEPGEHHKRVPRLGNDILPEKLWCFQGTAHVSTLDPFSDRSEKIRIHLVTSQRYRKSAVLIWDPLDGTSSRFPSTGEDDLGPIFDIPLSGKKQNFFHFKFISNPESSEELFEPEFANRVWTSGDGGEIWTHSEALRILTRRPEKKELRIFYRTECRRPALLPPVMRIWEGHSGFKADIPGEIQPEMNWSLHKIDVFTGVKYGFLFHNIDLKPDDEWEHPETKRAAMIIDDATFWTLEGDSKVFTSQPQMNRTVNLKIASIPPDLRNCGSLTATVRINQARWNVFRDLPVSSDGSLSFRTYPNVITSISFQSADGKTREAIDRHPLQVPEEEAEIRRFVTLNRPALLESPPPGNQFENPPFFIQRPGVWEEDGFLIFVVHCPSAARMRIMGEWTNWSQDAVEMKSTLDGTYWWAGIPIEEISRRLPPEFLHDYHGAHYRFLANDFEDFRDPASLWTDSSYNPPSSRLLRSGHFSWSDESWSRPGWDYLTTYQLHAGRFTNRFQHLPPLLRVAREIDADLGYLKQLGVTAVLLLPVNEVASSNSWGYDPAFFYAIEEDYGGPEALKELVDTCHRHSLAVLIDVVFNHAGCMDNILWSTARDTYFDGDTAWGAMINFDNPQCRHFFSQNLVYLAHEYHIDGFRLDHTHTIVHSNEPGSFVRVPGTGGGWEFLHSLRHAVKTQVGENCILIAEHLPNEWALTNAGGPMDSQWSDDFRDRLIDACRGNRVLNEVAKAFVQTQEVCDDWYKATIYPESHDEVGNVNDRIANVAGIGRGLRMSKVAGAATILGRGLPMFFMGAESGEHEQFKFGEATPLNITEYLANPDRTKVRSWWNEMCNLRRNPGIKGPAPLRIRFVEDQVMAFSRGDNDNFFVLLNFGGWAGEMSLGRLNLGEGLFMELWNSTWPAFSVSGEAEDEHTNGGRDARFHQGMNLNVPDYGVVVLEKV